MQNKPTLSFEFFPPKSDAASKHFWTAVEQLAELNPAFVTVTYGAGGSTRDATIDTAIEVHRRTGLPTAAHLTAIGTPRAELPAMAAKLWEGGVRHVVALRGDRPKDPGALQEIEEAETFHFANELIVALKAIHPFEISVGCYPEKHPESASAQADLDALRAKLDAGADRAITQFFFGTPTYTDFLARIRAAGITAPVAPGLLPIASFERMTSFAQACRATVPDWLRERFAGLAEGSAEARDAAIATLAEQCQGLIEAGVPHIHIYTLNRADLILAAIPR